jgi:pimeloyl-ACP methyl ester carboxylesterase
MTLAPVAVSLAGGTVHTLQGGAGPVLLFAHATGMCAAVYRALLEPLADRFRIVAFDARGHGRTTLRADPAAVAPDWRDVQADLVALVAALGVGPVLLAGHSLGATTAFEAAAAHPGLTRAVLLLDPPLIPMDQAIAFREARAAGQRLGDHMAVRAESRRAIFPDRATMFHRYHERGVFHGWPDAALHAYLAEGTHDLPDGRVALACDPAFEAAIFRAVTTTMGESLAAMEVPFALLAAAEHSTVGDADFARLAAHPRCQAAGRLAGSGHFLPVTHADQVRPWIAALATGAFPDR